MKRPVSRTDKKGKNRRYQAQIGAAESVASLSVEVDVFKDLSGHSKIVMTKYYAQRPLITNNGHREES